MVLAYMFAQLLPWVRGRYGGLLVLGSANVDERSALAPSQTSRRGPLTCHAQLARLPHEVRLLVRCVLPVRGVPSVLTRLAADVNPIGAISKTDLKRFIAYAQGAFDLPILEQYVAQPSPMCIAEGDLRQILDGSANRGARTYHRELRASRRGGYGFASANHNSRYTMAIGGHGHDLR